MSTVDTRVPSTNIPWGLLLIAIQWLPVNRSTTSGPAAGGGGAAFPGRPSGMSTPWP
jgi:hypothetical protein